MRTTFTQFSPLPERLLRAVLLPQRLPRLHALSIPALTWFHNNVPAAMSKIFGSSVSARAVIPLLEPTFAVASSALRRSLASEGDNQLPQPLCKLPPNARRSLQAAVGAVTSEDRMLNEQWQARTASTGSRPWSMIHDEAREWHDSLRIPAAYGPYHADMDKPSS